MEVLLIEKDPLVRDHVKVGLQQHADCHVTVGTGHTGISEARGRHFDAVFLGVDPRQKDTVKLLHALRSFNTTTELFVLTSPRNIKDMAVDKSKFDIQAFVPTPIDAKEFFRLLGRLIERQQEKEAPPAKKSARNQAPATGR